MSTAIRDTLARDRKEIMKHPKNRRLCASNTAANFRAPRFAMPNSRPLI
jgi:hypothetical protein